MCKRSSFSSSGWAILSVFVRHVRPVHIEFETLPDRYGTGTKRIREAIVAGK